MLVTLFWVGNDGKFSVFNFSFPPKLSSCFFTFPRNYSSTSRSHGIFMGPTGPMEIIAVIDSSLVENPALCYNTVL